VAFLHRVNFFLLLLPAIILLIIFAPVQIHFFARRERPGVIFYRCGVISWKLGISGKFQLNVGAGPSAETGLEKCQVLSFLRRLAKVFQNYRRFSAFFRRLLEKGRFRQFHWRLFLGTTDDALTGFAVGACWAVVESTFSRASEYTRFDFSGVSLQVIPSFGEPCFAVDFDCIFETRLHHIIIELIRSLLLPFLFRKLGVS
jgi:hypothetical protein